MGYDVKKTPDEDAVLNVEEPAVAYAVGRVTAKPWANTSDDREDEGEECPICAKHRDPATGEPRYNAETLAAIQETLDIISGKVKVKSYATVEEMNADIDAEEDD